MRSASCLCESIRFELRGELQAPRYCYCVHCTKFAGTSPASWIMARRQDIHWTTRGTVTRFDSGGGIRCFCSTCGSPVWFESKEDLDTLMLPLGVLDAADVPPPRMHMWVSSKPQWCAIHDDLPQHQTNPGNRAVDTETT